MATTHYPRLTLRKGPVVADSDTVSLRSPEGQEIEVAPVAVQFFTNQGYVVLTADGRVNSKATAAATPKETQS